MGTDDRYLYSLLPPVFLHDDPSPQDTTADSSSSTARWTRPSFLDPSRDGDDLSSHLNGPFVSLLIPAWLLTYLPSCKPTTTVPRGVFINLMVSPITPSNETHIHEHLDIWTRRFRRRSDIELRDVDDLWGRLPQSMEPKSLFSQLSVTDGTLDRERVVLKELGSYLEANSQV